MKTNRMSRAGMMRVVVLGVLCTGLVFADAGGNWDVLFAPDGVRPMLDRATRTTTNTYGECRSRTDNILAVKAAAGQTISIVVTNVVIGTATNDTSWELRDRNMSVKANGTMARGTSGTVTYTSPTEEVYFLRLVCGANATSIKSSNVPAGWYGGDGFHVFNKPSTPNNELFFKVPEKISSLSITLKSPVGEYSSVQIINPASTVVASGSTTSTNLTKIITADTGSYAGQVWKIKFTAVGGDLYLSFGSELPPVLALSNQDAFDFCPFGMKEGIRVMVDKVMAASTGYDIAEWMIQKAKESGFNVYVPRMYKGDSSERVTDMVQLRETAGWCQANGMKTLAWMRNTFGCALTNSVGDGKRYVRSSGEEYAIWSPNSTNFWTNMNQMVNYAAESRTNPGLIGAFVDLEIYTGTIDFAYDLSYDDTIISAFSALYSPPLEIPAALNERYSWLQANGYHEAFEAYQSGLWKTNMTQLRSAIDANNPAFQIFMYPYGSMRMPVSLLGADAAWMRFSTPAAPVVLAESMLYRKNVPLSAADTREYSKVVTDAETQSAEQLNRPYFLIGGVCSYTNWALPEYAGKTFVACADPAFKTQGYWIFYEGVTHGTELETEWTNWFVWAKNTINAGDWGAATNAYLDADLPSAQSYSLRTGVTKTFPTHTLRMTHAVRLYCTANETVHVKVKNSKYGFYTDDVLAWVLGNGFSTNIPVGKTNDVIFTPDHTGVYTLALNAGGSAAVILSSDVSLGVDAADFTLLSKYGSSESFYLYVPSSATNFTVSLKPEVLQETLKVKLYDANNVLVTSGETSTNSLSVTNINVSVSGHQPGVWKLELVPASTGVGGDVPLKIAGDISPVLSFNTNDIWKIAHAPVLATVNQTNNAGSTLTYTIPATDDDVLTYSLVSAPPGAALNAATGVFTWTPPLTQVPGNYTVTVRVTDNGTPPLSTDQTFTVTVQAPGLGLLFRLNTVSAGTVTDESGSNRTGTAINNPTFVLGISDKAMQFNAMTQYVETVAFANPTNAITVACWAKSDTATWNEVAMLISKRHAFILYPISGGKNIAFNMCLNGVWVYAKFNAPANFNIQQWHHYAGTYDIATKNIKIFVDGKEAATTNITTAYNIPSDSTGKLYVGWDDGQAGRYFDGAIDEVRLYDRALSSNEIVQLVAQASESLSSLWQTTNIGAQVEGFVVQSNTLFQVAGSGTNIIGSSDQFRLVYQSASGDCTDIARVVSVQNTSTNARAGVMIRESLTADSKQASLVLTPSSNVIFSCRSTTGGSCTTVTNTGCAPPQWLKVQRAGNVFSAYRSTNGTSWTQVGANQTITMNTATYIGLMTTSLTNGVLCNGMIDNVTITP